MSKIADLEVSIRADIAEFRSSMEQAKSSVSELAEGVKKAGEALVAFYAANEVVNFLREATNATLEWAKSIEELAQRTGLSAQAASDLAASAREQGLSIQQLDNFLDKITKRIATKPAEFKAFGIAIHDVVHGGLLPLQQIGESVLKTLDEYKEGANRDAAANALLGRGAAEVIANFERLKDALDAKNIKEVGDYIRALGLEMTESGIARAREWEKAEEDLKLALLAVQNAIGQAILPLLKELADWIKLHAKDNQMQIMFLRFADAMITVAKVARELIVVLGELAKAYNWFERNIANPIERVADAGNRAIYGANAGNTTLMKSMANMGAGADELSQASDAINKRIRDLQNGVKATGEETEKAGNKGTKLYSEKLAEAGSNAVTLDDKVAKLTLKLQQQVASQTLLANAALQGTAATQAANVEIQTATDLLSLYNEKTHEAVARDSERGRAIAALNAQIQQQRTLTAAHVEIYDLSQQVADQQRLTEAQLHGVAAVNATATAIKAETEIRRLGIATDGAEAQKIRELTEAKEHESKVTDITKSLADMDRQIAQQRQMTAAYGESTRAANEMAAAQAAENQLIEAGIPLNSELGQTYIQRALDEQRATEQENLARKSAEENDQAFQTIIDDTAKFGEGVMTAFEEGKKGSQSFKQQVLSDFQNLVKEIEHELLKTLVFDKIKAALTGATSGAGGAGGAPGAGGGASGMGGLLGSIMGMFGGGQATSSSDIITASAQTGMPLSTFANSSYAGTGGAGAGMLPWLMSFLPAFEEGGVVVGNQPAVPIIAHRGEEVIPANQRGMRGMTVQQNFMINTPDANSFRAAQGHIAADAHRAVIAAGRRS